MTPDTREELKRYALPELFDALFEWHLLYFCVRYIRIGTGQLHARVHLKIFLINVTVLAAW